MEAAWIVIGTGIFCSILSFIIGWCAHADWVDRQAYNMRITYLMRVNAARMAPRHAHIIMRRTKRSEAADRFWDAVYADEYNRAMDARSPIMQYAIPGGENS